jgi:uncharacterized protein (DUF58 family)
MGARQAAAARFRRPYDRPLLWLQERARGWARRRQGVDPDPVTLERRRTYILPTGLGVGFGLMLFAMLLASMNYNNSMGFGLTFMLAGLGLVAMHWCHQNLTGARIRGFRTEPAFAGQPLALELHVENPSRSTRYELVFTCARHVATPVDLAPGESRSVRIELPTQRRGRLPIEGIRVSTRFPFHLFTTWTWLHPDLSGIVYPQPAPPGDPPPPDSTDVGGAQDDSRGEDDFAGLRNFRPGDSPRHVAWKAAAREGDLLVKQFAGTDVTTHWLDWASVDGRDTEDRLAQLCRWVIDAHSAGHAFGLRIPGTERPPAVGRRHRHRCLTALADYPGDGRADG